MVNTALIGCPDTISWSLSSNGPMQLQYVFIGWLKHPDNPAFADTKKTLDKAGITSSDYATILSQDPIATGATQIDPNRYTLLGTTIPYQANENVPQQNTIYNDYINTLSTSSSTTYDVGVSASASLGIFKAGSSADYAWTNSIVKANTQEHKIQGSYSIFPPSSNYNGPTMIDVYFDVLYNTFLFAFDPMSNLAQRDAAAMVKGVVKTNKSKTKANEEVLLNINGKTYRTFTNSKGEYFFYKVPKGEGKLVVHSKSKSISVTSRQLRKDISL